MNITSENTVGEVAAAYPSTVRVFEQYHVDYCCGGNRSIAEACAKKNIAVNDLIASLNRAWNEAQSPTSNVQDWTKTGLTELIDYILETHHQYLYSELPRLHQMLSKVIRVHGAGHPESLIPLGRTFEALEAELEGHLLKEERVLFPLIKGTEAAKEKNVSPPEFGCGPVDNPIQVMKHEHDNAGNALLEMRRLTNDYTPPEDACNTYRALFHGLLELESERHQHIHLENNILFPRAITLEKALI
jgi:regulator of cell morphogenesis and NO signaling